MKLVMTEAKINRIISRSKLRDPFYLSVVSLYENLTNVKSYADDAKMDETMTLLDGNVRDLRVNYVRRCFRYFDLFLDRIEGDLNYWNDVVYAESEKAIIFKEKARESDNRKRRRYFTTKAKSSIAEVRKSKRIVSTLKFRQRVIESSLEVKSEFLSKIEKLKLRCKLGNKRIYELMNSITLEDISSNLLPKPLLEELALNLYYLRLQILYKENKGVDVAARKLNHRHCGDTVTINNVTFTDRCRSYFCKTCYTKKRNFEVSRNLALGLSNNATPYFLTVNFGWQDSMSESLSKASMISRDVEKLFRKYNVFSQYVIDTTMKFNDNSFKLMFNSHIHAITNKNMDDYYFELLEVVRLHGCDVSFSWYNCEQFDRHDYLHKLNYMLMHVKDKLLKKSYGEAVYRAFNRDYKSKLLLEVFKGKKMIRGTCLNRENSNVRFKDAFEYCNLKLNEVARTWVKKNE